MKRIATLALLLFISITNVLAGTTGKISGIVKDARSGDPLVGANISVEGSKLGASSTIDGSFAIVNVPSGEYRLRASLLGYTPTSVVGVRVFIDQT